MAELSNDCCDPQVQTTCCAPEEKSGCCGQHGDQCGCAAGGEPNDIEGLRESVRARHAAAAAAGTGESEGGRPDPTLTDEHGTLVFGSALYDSEEADSGALAALESSLGCGVPTAVADLHEGETVLDLDSGPAQPPAAPVN